MPHDPHHAEHAEHDDHAGHAHDHGHHQHDEHAPAAHGHAHHDHDHGHGHGHGGHHHGPPASERKLFWTLVLTGGFMFAEAIGGWLAGSLALLADAAHMLTDAAALLMAFTAVRAASRPATPEMSFGHHRWQVLAAFVNGLGLLVLSAWILIEAALRLSQPLQVQGGMVMVIAALGLLVNLGSFAILTGGEQNLNTRAALAHVLGDLLGSVAALLAGAVIWYWGWMPADPILSAVVALLMIRTGWNIARQSAHVLLEGAPAGISEAAVRQAVSSAVPSVSNVHHVHAWSLTDDKPVVTLHAQLREHSDHDQSLQAIQDVLRERFGIQHSTIQIEQQACAPQQACV